MEKKFGNILKVDGNIEILVKFRNYSGINLVVFFSSKIHKIVAEISENVLFLHLKSYTKNSRY